MSKLHGSVPACCLKTRAWTGRLGLLGVGKNEVMTCEKTYPPRHPPSSEQKNTQIGGVFNFQLFLTKESGSNPDIQRTLGWLYCCAQFHPAMIALVEKVGGGFKYFFLNFLPRSFKEMIQFDIYFSGGLKTQTSNWNFQWAISARYNQHFSQN